MRTIRAIASGRASMSGWRRLGQPPVLLLDLGRGRGPGHAQDRVRVLRELCRHLHLVLRSAWLSRMVRGRGLRGCRTAVTDGGRRSAARVRRPGRPTCARDGGHDAQESQMHGDGAGLRAGPGCPRGAGPTDAIRDDRRRRRRDRAGLGRAGRVVARRLRLAGSGSGGQSTFAWWPGATGQQLAHGDESEPVAGVVLDDDGQHRGSHLRPAVEQHDARPGSPRSAESAAPRGVMCGRGVRVRGAPEHDVGVAQLARHTCHPRVPGTVRRAQEWRHRPAGDRPPRASGCAPAPRRCACASSLRRSMWWYVWLPTGKRAPIERQISGSRAHVDAVGEERRRDRGTGRACPRWPGSGPRPSHRRR